MFCKHGKKKLPPNVEREASNVFETPIRNVLDSLTLLSSSGPLNHIFILILESIIFIPTCHDFVFYFERKKRD